MRARVHAREILILHSLRWTIKLWGSTMIVVPHVGGGKECSMENFALHQLNDKYFGSNESFYVSL